MVDITVLTISRVRTVGDWSLELASVPCSGTVNHSIFQGGAVQVDVDRIRTVKRHHPFTRYSTRRTVVEFYLYPTVGTVLIHSIKPELTE